MHPQNIRPQSNNASEEPFLNQAIWHEIDECPEGTVPIKRLEDVDEELLMKMKGRANHNNLSYAVSNDKFIHEVKSTTFFFLSNIIFTLSG